MSDIDGYSDAPSKTWQEPADESHGQQDKSIIYRCRGTESKIKKIEIKLSQRADKQR